MFLIYLSLLFLPQSQKATSVFVFSNNSNRAVSFEINEKSITLSPSETKILAAEAGEYLISMDKKHWHCQMTRGKIMEIDLAGTSLDKDEMVTAVKKKEDDGPPVAKEEKTVKVYEPLVKEEVKPIVDEPLVKEDKNVKEEIAKPIVVKPIVLKEDKTVKPIIDEPLVKEDKTVKPIIDEPLVKEEPKVATVLIQKLPLPDTKPWTYEEPAPESLNNGPSFSHPSDKPTVSGCLVVCFWAFSISFSCAVSLVSLYVSK